MGQEYIAYYYVLVFMNTVEKYTVFFKEVRFW